MTAVYRNILSPIGIARAQAPKPAKSKLTRTRPVIGLLDNSKPNAALFLEGVAAKLDEDGDYDVVRIAKPRSAAACAELDGVAARCDFVVNAVAD